MKTLFVYVEEMHETYRFKTEKDYKVFEPVQIVGLDGKTYNGFVLDENIAIKVHPCMAKIVLR